MHNCSQRGGNSKEETNADASMYLQCSVFPGTSVSPSREIEGLTMNVCI